jgi:predicted dehydrogenase
MRNVKILGAGSIGNHLANASRALGWHVTVCDPDPAALERTRTQIYPARYGKWDDAIQLCHPKDAPRGGFDLICIGTPPDVHVPLAIDAVAESPRCVLVEKPLCGPGLEHMDELVEKADAAGVAINVGYDHVLAKATARFDELIRGGFAGTPVTLDVEFREHWGGIFGAHPWLSGPWDSYLGFWQRGGGAGGEHSHATNLWQHFARTCGAGAIATVSALVEYRTERNAEYDALFSLNVRTTSGFPGRIIQDVVTRPTRKWARLQGSEAALEWHANQGAKGDVVLRITPDGKSEEFTFPKTRPDDFIWEMQHLDAVMNGTLTDSPTSLARGVDTMRVVAAGYQSAREQKTVTLA